MESNTQSWAATLRCDPVPWLLEAGEPSARWLTLVALLDRPAEDPEVAETHAAVMADPTTISLLDRLSPWDEVIPLSGHDKLDFAPNLISLLADMGVTSEDDERIARVIESMLEHQAADGRFEAVGRWGSLDEPVWGALPCDSFAIAETVARAGHGEAPRVRRAFDRIRADLVQTDQGVAWDCRPDPRIPFRGPGRKADMCPQATIEALRAYSYVPRADVPDDVIGTVSISLQVWRDRARSKPYMFGHGRQFKRGKWPATWYSALEVVDTLGRYPEVWDDERGDSDDRRALAEIVACLVAYDFDTQGRVTPRSCYKGYEEHSFGQKKRPSPFATARTCVALRRVQSLANDVADVDVSALGSSKGGSGVPLPP